MSKPVVSVLVLGVMLGGALACSGEDDEGVPGGAGTSLGGSSSTAGSPSVGGNALGGAGGSMAGSTPGGAGSGTSGSVAGGAGGTGG